MLLNILGLAVAYAAFIIIFMQSDYDLNFDKFHTDSQRIFRLNMEGVKGKQALVSLPVAELLGDLPQVEVSSISNGWIGEIFFTVNDKGALSSYKERSVSATPAFTSVFELQMIEGSEKALEEPDRVLLPESMSKRIFGGESAVGKVLKLPESEMIVGGVYKDLPHNSTFGNTIFTKLSTESDKNSWGNWSYNAFVKLKTEDSGEQMLDALKKKLESIDADTQTGNFFLVSLPDLHFTTDISYDFVPKSSRQTIFVLITLGFVILIIASVNFTNFNIALIPLRIRSINTRKVLGATNSGLRASLLLEAVLLNLIAFGLGLLIVYFSGKSFISTLVDTEISISLYPSLIVIICGISIVTGILAGLYPSIYLTSFQPALMLRGSFALSPGGKKMRGVLIGIQYVASFVLIICAVFMYLQYNYMQNKTLGFDKDQMIITEMSHEIRNNKDVFSNQLKMHSGIEDVTFADNMLSTSDNYMGWTMPYQENQITFQCLPVYPSFLKVLGIEIAEGRDFRESDRENAGGTYIFNETARKQYNIELNSEINGGKIIGFIPDINYMTFRATTSPMAFFVYSKDGWWSDRAYFAYIKVKAGSDMNEAMDHVKNTLNQIDPAWPFDVRFYDNVLDQVYKKEQRLTQLISLFSVLAILISIIGVFGLVVFETMFRRKEISIRKVLGSSVNEILGLFNRIYLIILFICFIIACPVAYFIVNNWLENFTERTQLHIWVFLLSGIIIALVTIGIVNWQSRKAATANPVDSLKNE